MFSESLLDELKRIINPYQFVSFDMFDTLIKRDCWRPTELFSFVEARIDQEFQRKTKFCYARIAAERIARRESHLDEITLDEIYAYLDLGLNKEELEYVKQLEMKYEYALCQVNPCMKSVYDYCVSQGKNIVVTTDIYLPESLVKNILNKACIQCDRVYVSSSRGFSKEKGSLFKKVLKDLSIKPSELIHIGDNWRSDYRIPKKMGIRAVHIKKDESMNLFLNKGAYKKYKDYANLCAFISNHVGEYLRNNKFLDSRASFFAQTGYETQGPTLYGYIKWLHHQFKRDKIENVFFLARDGQLMRKAYQQLTEALPNSYMFASRKSLIVPSLWMSPTLKNITDLIFWGRRGTITSFLKKIGLEPDEFAQCYKNVGLSIDEIYVYQSLWKNTEFQSVFENHVKSKMVSHSYDAYELLIQYLKQIHFEGKVAIVDIGWFGHMQAALEKIVRKAGIPVEIHGYYLGLRPESRLLKHMNAKGYLFDKDYNHDVSDKEKQFNSIIEMLFTADHGTTKGFEKEYNRIVPVLGKWEYAEKVYQKDYEAIRLCQDGALAFVEDMLKCEMYFPFIMDSNITFLNWLQFGGYPSKRAAEYFGNLHFLDDSVSSLAKSQSVYLYLFHPIAFLRDFCNSWWRMGFLTRAFGDKVPYEKGYEVLRKLY